MAGDFGSVWTVRSLQILLAVTFHYSPLRHVFYPSTPNFDRAKSIGGTSRDENISKKGPQKGIQIFRAFGGGHFRGAGGSDADDVCPKPGKVRLARSSFILTQG